MYWELRTRNFNSWLCSIYRYHTVIITHLSQTPSYPWLWIKLERQHVFVIQIFTQCFCCFYFLSNINFYIGNYCWWDWKTWYKACQSWSGSNVYFYFLLFWVHSCFPYCQWNCHSDLLEFELYYIYMQCHKRY